jgi:hypothetical protein
VGKLGVGLKTWKKSMAVVQQRILFSSVLWLVISCLFPSCISGWGKSDPTKKGSKEGGGQAAEARNNEACPDNEAVRVNGAGCYATIREAIADLPLTGGTIVIPAGNYPCPDDVIGKSNIQLIGESYDPPAERSHGINSSWLSLPDKKVVFQCTTTWTIDSSNGLVIAGIQIQMVGRHGSDGLVLKAVTNSKFSDFSIIGNGSGEKGVGLHIFGRGTTGTNSSRDTFQDFLISGFDDGSIALTGTSPSQNCVTLNEFRNYWLTSGPAPNGPAISTSYCTDSNYWYSGTVANLGDRQSGLTINKSDPTVETDSGGNGFFGITMQPANMARYTGPLFQFNQSQGTLIEGASITGGLSGNVNGKIVGTTGSPQFRICFVSNFSAPSYSSSCVDQVSYSGVNDTSRSGGIDSGTLYSVPAGAAGFYRVYGELWTSHTGRGSVSFTVVSNIGGYMAGQTSSMLSLESENAVSFSFDVFAAGGTPIRYRTTYTPSGSYGLRLRIAYEPQGN